jgi:hypothetical protein
VRAVWPQPHADAAVVGDLQFPADAGRAQRHGFADRGGHGGPVFTAAPKASQRFDRRDHVFAQLSPVNFEPNGVTVTE